VATAARIAIIFSLETVFAGLAGYLFADDRIGVVGFAGCAAIFAGIVIAEPAAAATLKHFASGRVRSAA
jgi:drug/metabolite transporter (DMT)-like permease